MSATMSATMSTLLLPFLVFATAASLTPGPNNVMLLATGASFGYRAAIPVVIGVCLGFGFMVAAIGLGAAGFLVRHPQLQIGLRWIGAAWLLWLAWKIGSDRGVPKGQPRSGSDRAFAPIGLWRAAALQWVNPKAWVLAVATATTYTVPGRDMTTQTLTLAALFTAIGFVSATAWALLGAVGGRLIGSAARMRAFNVAMGLLLASSVIPVLLE